MENELPLNWQKELYEQVEFCPGDRVAVTEDHTEVWYGIIERVLPRYYLIRTQFNYSTTVLKNDLATGHVFMRKDKR